jgi:hypothetical protein
MTVGPDRHLVTRYKDGQLFIEGLDVVVIHKGKEVRLQLAQVEVKKTLGTTWSIKPMNKWSGYTLRKPDNEPGLVWLREHQPAVETYQAVLDISGGRAVAKRFRLTPVAFRDGYLILSNGRARVPAHMVEFAGTESRQVQRRISKGGRVEYGTDWFVALYGSGTKLGEAECWQDTANQAADWINRILHALREQHQRAMHEAQETRIPLVTCTYCGTRVQNYGRCGHCGAPLPET